MMDHAERQLRIDGIRRKMKEIQVESCLISTPVNTYYVHGQIFKGYTFISQDTVFCFVRRPSDLTGDELGIDSQHFAHIHKPEQIPNILGESGIPMPESLLAEGEEMPRSEWLRIEKSFPKSLLFNGSHALRQVRSVKTPYELDQIRESGRLHAQAYRAIPSVWKNGMSELDFLIEIEYLMRKNGCLGLFRTYGNDMEAFMGSLLAGDNAVQSSPYDFALGGSGHPSNPIGAASSFGNRRAIGKGQSILVDMCGNFTGYLDDLSRCFSYGKLTSQAYQAHQTALEIQDRIRSLLLPGQSCSQIYGEAIRIAEKAGWQHSFMGSRQQARFVGHGVGLVINELPVLAPRMDTLLEEGMVLAVEPKIIVEGVGAVGVENTFIVTAQGAEKVADLADEIVELG